LAPGAGPDYNSRVTDRPPAHPLRIGTRGSPMALHQAGLVRERLSRAHPALAAGPAIEIVAIRTTGDRVQDRRLAEIGGKGLFAKEIDEALIGGHIDIAVHSLKDLETRLPDGIEIAAVLPRDDPRDAFLSPRAERLADLPAGAVIGTASLRRQAQLLRRRPDLIVVPLRGNANTRIRKLEAGEVDATLLALCGLQRLGLAHLAREILPTEVMLPAVGQGALAVTCRAADEVARRLTAPLDDPESAACARAERAMLAALDGSCHTPIAALAEIAEGRLAIEGRLLTADGRREIRTRRAGEPVEAAALGQALGEELRAGAGPQFGLAAL
jgi:hydroxymethylbilane synthase